MPRVSICSVWRLEDTFRIRMRIVCHGLLHDRGQPASIVFGQEPRLGDYGGGPLVSRATRAVRASGLDHDITDTPTVDRHEQTRVERECLQDSGKFGKVLAAFLLG